MKDWSSAGVMVVGVVVMATLREQLVTATRQSGPGQNRTFGVVGGSQRTRCVNISRDTARCAGCLAGMGADRAWSRRTQISTTREDVPRGARGLGTFCISSASISTRIVPGPISAYDGAVNDDLICLGSRILPMARCYLDMI